MKPFTSTNAIPISVEAGFATILELPPIDSVPEPVVSWKEGTRLVNPDGLNQYVTLDNNLVLLAVDTSDDGKVYSALIHNGHAGDTNHSPDYNLQVTSKRLLLFTLYTDLFSNKV